MDESLQAFHSTSVGSRYHAGYMQGRVYYAALYKSYQTLVNQCTKTFNPPPALPFKAKIKCTRQQCKAQISKAMSSLPQLTIKIWTCSSPVQAGVALKALQCKVFDGASKHRWLSQKSRNESMSLVKRCLIVMLTCPGKSVESAVTKACQSSSP